MSAELRDALTGKPADYVRHGWLLVPIPVGSKGPRHKGWNKRENCIADAARAAALRDNVGIAHAYSGTCSIDFDRLDDSTKWLKERGIDVSELLNAFDAVLISSGRPNRTKLLYRLPSPLPSLTLAYGALEFRCATRSGATTQDLLPPSVHPDTQQPYRWKYPEPLIGHWSMLPTIPLPLLALWRSLLASPPSPQNPARTAAPNELRRLGEALAKRDPDSEYDEWVRIGMALHHASGGAENGFRIWSSWSQRGTKYRGDDDLRPALGLFLVSPRQSGYYGRQHTAERYGDGR